jgi:hypothetical protein
VCSSFGFFSESFDEDNDCLFIAYGCSLGPSDALFASLKRVLLMLDSDESLTCIPFNMTDETVSQEY